MSRTSIVFFIVVLFFFSQHLFSAPISSNAVTGNWNSPSSWVGGVVPGVNDTVTIVNGANITLNTNAAVYKLRINTGGVLNLSSYTLQLNGNGSDYGSMSIYGTLNLNTGTLELTGNFFTGSSANPGVFNCNTGTVNFKGNQHQMISGQTQPVFYNLMTSNTNNAIEKGVTGHPVSTTIKGNFVANGVFNRSSENNYPAKVVFDGNTTLSGAYSFFLNHIEINTGATLNAGNKTIYIYGNWTNNGTFVCGTGTLWFSYDPNHPSHPNQNIINYNASSNPFNNIYINKTTGSVTPVTHPSDPSNPNGHIWMNGNFTINNGTWVNGNRHHYVKKDFIVNNGTYNAGTGILRLSGSSQQLLRTNSNSSLYKLYMENSSGGVLLASDITITDNLLLTNGHIFTTEAYQVYVSNNSTGAVSYNNQGSFIVGRLRRAVGTGTANYLFPIGPMNVSPLKYRPITYEQTNNGGASSISMISDTISWGNTHTANWYVRIGSNAGNPVGNFLFQYHLTQDFPTNTNECALSINRGTLPPPANWNFVLPTVTGSSGGSTGGIRASIPSSLSPFAYIIGEPVPQINNTSVCSGNTATLSVIQPTGSGSFNWYNAQSGGTLLQANASSYTTPPLSITTTYYVAHVNNNTSCVTAYRAPVTVTVGASMNINIIPNGPTSICGNGSVVLDAGSGYTSYNWSTGASTQTLTASTQGVYSVTVSDGMGCGGSGSINVSITPLPGNASAITGPATLCVGGVATYTTPAVSNATTYQWYVPQGVSITSGQGSNTISVVAYANTTGSITVTPGNDCGNGSASSISITAAEAPEAPLSISGLNAVCAGQITTYTIPYVNGATGYQWDVPSNTTIVSGNGTNSITLDWGTATTGTITVTPYNSCGNGTPTSLYVTVSQLPPSIPGNINGPLFVCQGEITNYFVNPATGATGYIWEAPPGISISGGQNTNNITVVWDMATSGFVKVTPTNGCGLGQTDSVFVVSQPSPNVPAIGDSLNFCGNDTVYLYVPHQAGVTVNWWNSETGGQIIATGDSVGIYFNTSASIWVEAIGSNGCSNPGGRKEIAVAVYPQPSVSLSCDATDNTAILGQSVSFTASHEFFSLYDFSVNTILTQSGTAHTYLTNVLQSDDIIGVWVTDENGCMAYDSLKIAVMPIPNAFTPNSDGINDIFMKNYDLTIINRWGQELYKGYDGWDGKYKGEDVAAGTYFFVLTYKGLNEEIVKVTGPVALSR